jgi:hypothetical protein
MTAPQLVEICADRVPVQIVFPCDDVTRADVNTPPEVIWGYPIKHEYCQGHDFAICAYGLPKPGWAAVHVPTGFRATRWYSDAGVCLQNLLSALKEYSALIDNGYLESRLRLAKSHRAQLWAYFEAQEQRNCDYADVR